MWGAGCILFELTMLYPLFPGSDEADQVHRIHRVLGTPKATVVAKFRKHASAHVNFAFPRQAGIGIQKLLPEAAASCVVDLLEQSVAYDTSERITCRDAMTHRYFVGDQSFPPVKSKVGIMTRGRNRRAKVAPLEPQAIASTSSFPSDPKKMAESDKASGPVKAAAEPSITKPRSMVSILLARVSTHPSSHCSAFVLMYMCTDMCLHLRFITLNNRIIRRSSSKNQRPETIPFTGKQEERIMLAVLHPRAKQVAIHQEPICQS